MKDNKYSTMQKNFYNNRAIELNKDNKQSPQALSTPELGYNDGIVGSIFLLNEFFSECSFLFSTIEDTKNKIALDFGCGPGRNIVLYKDMFKRIDGVDISEIQLENAKKVVEHNNISSNLYACNGYNLDKIGDEVYDVVFSFITLQHICVYDIRRSYLEEFYRVLKPNGTLEFQMSMGPDDTRIGRYVNYYDNCYEAEGTNGCMDVLVDSAEEIEKDLQEIGFQDIMCATVDVSTRNWNHDKKFIFVTCKK